MTKAVDEFVGLNGRRQQSYFHAGFRDALFDLGLNADLPARNEKRARWYWAGATQGLARAESWDRIVEAYDSVDVVRMLGDGRDPASRMAGGLIVEALWRTGRTSELHVFVDVRLAREPNIYRLMLEAGTESLRSRNPGVARTVFALLMETADLLRSESPLSDDVPTVRRRMAHCLRLLGERQGAEDLLRGLLHDEVDANIHAMVHADLGLLKGGFALLDEVRIPSDEAARHDIVDRLRDGEEHFRDAVANLDATYACHGHYCLGVLLLADDSRGDERFREADTHLERAHATIRSGRAYPASLVAQTDLYLGIAKSQLFDAAEIRHAARLIVAGLPGAEIPRHFIAATVESLALSDDGMATVLEPLLEAGGDETLDALAAEVLDVYRRPYDPARPVVCMDETPRQLIGRSRPSIPAEPGGPEREDHEYRRLGTCNVFMATEPLAGRRMTKVTDRRTKTDWAHFLDDIAGRYAVAERITLVMDNLNTHRPGALYETFPPARAKALRDRFDFVTPPGTAAGSTSRRSSSMS